MRLFGRWQLTRIKQANLSPLESRGAWWPLVREPFAGAWQRNQEITRETVLTYSAVFACVTLIASDIGKLRIKLTQEIQDGIWEETDSPAFSPVLYKPNHYQTRIKFIESWILSKLIHGNAYLLKQRDGRGVVTALYPLDPSRVTPLVAPDGAIYYQLRRDDLSRVAEDVIVPAREIIHDPMVTLYHPLVGISPITACGLAALQGLKIQDNSTKFFGNGANPSGVLTAPGEISDDTAKRLKDYWEASYTGQNVGKIAVLGDGLKYEAMTVNATDAQLIEQLKWTAETVCSVFRVPPYMIGIGSAPSYNNIEALNQQYYAQCLQTLIESLEAHLDEGLELPDRYGTELDLDNLLRMDTAARYKAHSDAVGGGWMSPNEARWAENLPPVDGGDSPMIQQQYYSLAALSQRDRDKPFAKPTPATPAQAPGEEMPAETAAAFLSALHKALLCELT